MGEQFSLGMVGQTHLLFSIVFVLLPFFVYCTADFSGKFMVVFVDHI